MKRITAQMLKERGACASEVQRFRKVFPVGAPVSMRSLVRAQKAGLDVFFAECFLAGPAMAECQKVKDQALAEWYWKLTGPAEYSEYCKVTGPALAEYERVVGQALVAALIDTPA